MIRLNRPYPLILLIIAIVASQSAYSQSEATAEYNVKFTGNWTLSSTPGGVVGSAHFTTIAGGKHNSSVSFWEPGGTATSGLEGLAELGSTGGFLNEINASSHTDASFTSGVSFGGTGTSTFTLTVKKTHPLITLATMIGPSPDWFVGLHGYSLLDTNSNWVSSVAVNLYPYDAGTEDGTEFTLSNPATSPRGVITSLRGVGKFSNEPMATISFTRRNVPPPPPAPSITSIQRPSNTSERTNADSVTWIVTFSEAVQHVSTNDFVVNGATATVTSVSLVSGSTTQYRLVVSGGNLANFNGVISLGLSSSQNITNSAEVGLSTTLPSNADGYTIDNNAPSVSSVLPTRAEASPFTVTITFNEDLQLNSFTDASDVSSDDAAVSTPTGSRSNYQVSVTPNDPLKSSTISLTIPAGAGSDLAGNLSSAHETSIEYQPDEAPIRPVVNSVSAITPDGSYHAGETIEIGVSFSESVTVTGEPTLTLRFDDITRSANYDRGSHSSTLVFSYALVAGDATSDLGYTSSQALSLAGGSIIGSGGQPADITLPSPGTRGSLRQNSDIETSGREVDTTPPIVNDVSAITVDGLYHIGDTIEIGVTFTQTVTVTGTPTLDLQFEGATRSAPYDRGSDSRILVFSYSLVSGDASSDLGYVSAQALNLADGSIIGMAGQSADVTLPSPGANGSLRQNSDIKTSGRQDTMPSFDNTDIDDQILMMNQLVEAISLPSAMGGDAPLRYALAPTLPPGLQFDTTTRSISGTPIEVFDMTTYTWSVTDADGDVVRLSFTIMVLPRLPLQFPSSASIADQVLLQNDAIETVELPAVRGGDGALTYSLTPELPTGLTLDLEARQITGTPTAVLNMTDFTWKVTDEGNATVSLTFSMTVLQDFQPEFDVTSGSIDHTFTQDSPIKPFLLPRAISGNGQLNHELVTELPMGLVLDMDSFEISGTPTEPQSRRSFHWMATDEDGDSSAFTFYVTVLEDLMPSFPSDTSLLEREFITDSAIEPFTLPSATSGNGLLNYDLTPMLPDGLELDENSYEISGTPVEPLQRTQFTWSVQDQDGDANSLSFYLAVILDTQPSFSEQVPDKVFIVGTPIDSFTLPVATGGNGDLSYELMPDLPSGLSLDASTNLISGTPTVETSTASYSWTVTDVDRDSVSLSFTILVHPAAPEVTDTIPIVGLLVGGGTETVNARTVIEGKVDSWQVDVADSNVVTASVSTTGMVMLTPRIEGQTNVTLNAMNVTDSVQITFSVRVITDAVENEQIDAALAFSTGAVLSSAMSVFKKRSNLHEASNGDGGSSLRLTSRSGFGKDRTHVHSDNQTDLLTDLKAFDVPSAVLKSNNAFGSEFVPLNFTHTATKWSLWGAVDLQNYSSDSTNNRIDGSLSSLYLGADFSINQNTFAGFAIASHEGSTDYEFTSADADGNGEIDSSFTGIYPYLQAGDGHRFSMFLVGGFGSGNAEIDRRHANGSESGSDADLSLFAGGFDYVVIRRASLDVAIVGDAGVATVTTEGDVGVLANRELTSSRSSIGGSVSFNHQVEGGSLVTAADVRLAAGADDDTSRTGFELGANLNYVGEHLDFMLDGRTSTRSGDTDAQKSSLSARFRYKASADGSGLTIAVTPRWHEGSALVFDNHFGAPNQVSALATIDSDPLRSVEGEIGYGIWMNNETTLFRPSLRWQRLDAYENVLTLGTNWNIGRDTKSQSVFRIDVFRNSKHQGKPIFGLIGRVEKRI